MDGKEKFSLLGVTELVAMLKPKDSVLCVTHNCSRKRNFRKYINFLCEISQCHERAALNVDFVSRNQLI